MTFGNMRFLSAWLLSIIIIFSLTQQSVNANELSKEEEDYIKKNGPLIFVSQTNYPPFEFIASDGDHTGMCIDLVRWIATEFGFKVNFTDTSFKQAQDDVLSGKAHILTSLFYSEKRDQVFDFTKTVFTVPASIFVMAKRPDIKNANDLQGKIIAMQSGDYAQEFLESKGIKCSYQYTTNFAEATDLVIADKADAIIGDEQIVLYHIFSSDLTDRIKKVGEPLYIGQNCMGAKDPNPILIGIMNKGIELAQNKGVLDQIYKKWIGTRYSQQPSWWQQFFPYFLYLIAGFILVTVLGWVWNIRLRQTVLDRTGELSKSEEILRTILNASPLGIGIARGRILGWHNETMSRMLGYPQGELEGQNIKVLYQDNHHLEQAGYWSKDPVQRNSVNSVETCWIRKDGSVFPCQLRSAPLRLQDDKSMTITIAEDITERKRAEIIIKDSEKKYKALFNNAQVALFRTRISDGKLIEINERYANMVGYSTIGDCMAEFNSADAWADTIGRDKLVETLQENGFVLDYETKIIRRDKVSIWISFSATIFQEQGYIEGSIVDITERKQAEEEKAKLEEAFYKEKETLLMILERTPHGISLVDNDGKYLYLNPYYTKITGYTLEDIPSKEEWFKKVYPDENYRKEIIDAWNKDILEGELGKIREFKIKCKNGDTKHIEFRSAFLKDKKISVLTDVTSRKESEEIVREKDRMQGVLELSGAVSHEMSQPLMSVLGYFDIILLDMPADDPNYSRICKIQTQLERMSYITKKLMEISRYQTKDYLDGRIYDLVGTSKTEKSN